MGDLKKNKSKDNTTTDYIVDTDTGKEIIIEHNNTYKDEEVIEKLRDYIQKFYDLQEEKIKKSEQDVREGKRDGQV